jgi:hypothetical protein
LTLLEAKSRQSPAVQPLHAREVEVGGNKAFAGSSKDANITKFKSRRAGWVHCFGIQEETLIRLLTVPNDKLDLADQAGLRHGGSGSPTASLSQVRAVNMINLREASVLGFTSTCLLLVRSCSGVFTILKSSSAQ